MSIIKVVKIEMRSADLRIHIGSYYEKADDLKAISGMVETHIQDSNGDKLLLSVEMMDEEKYNELPEFMGF